MGPKCVCVHKYNFLMRLNNPSQMRKVYEQKKQENCRIPSSENWEKIIQWSLLWIIINGKIEINHLLTQRSVCRDDNFLQT